MARIHGNRGAVYLSTVSGAAPTLVAYQAAWSATFTAAAIDVTTIQSEQAQYIRGALSVSGDFSGFYDDLHGTTQTYLAAYDRQPRTLTIYPDAANPDRLLTGTVLADFNTASGVTAGASVSATWAAASGTQFVIAAGSVYTPVYVAVY